MWFSIEISLKIIHEDPTNNIPRLVQIVAWRPSGDKPLSKSMMVSLPTHICVTPLQRVNPFRAEHILENVKISLHFLSLLITDMVQVVEMMTSSNGNISASLALCAGNSPVPVNSPHKGQWRGALVFSLICVWINGWVNSREPWQPWWS